jgi:hypothetical protein
MPVLVKEMRLSLLWKKAFPGDTYLPYLSDPDRYSQEFEKAGKGTGKWLLPWAPKKYQRFWSYYLLRKEPGDFHSITSQAARDYFVPLRAPACAQAKARSGAIASLEGYCSPHSVGAVVNLYLRPDKPLPMDQMVDAALAARYADYNLAWKDGSAAIHGALESLADKIIDRLHEELFGGAKLLGKPLRDPVTVATIIDATGTSQKPENGVGLGRALNSLCLFKLGWRDLPRETGFLADDMGPMDEQIHHIANGRANWIPKHFSENELKGRQTSLGCYHRNITLASLQVMSLTALVGRADEVLATPKGTLLKIPRRDVVKAIELLNDFDRGDQQTYMSGHLAHQISFNRDRIDRVSKLIGV